MREPLVAELLAQVVGAPVTLRQVISSYRAGTASAEDLQQAVHFCADSLRSPAQWPACDASARSHILATASPEIGPLVIRLAEDLDLHEEEARAFILLATVDNLLPSDPYFLPPSLQHYSRAKRLVLFRRHTLICAVEELLALREFDSFVVDVTGALLGLPGETAAAQGLSESGSTLPRSLMTGMDALTSRAASVRERDPFDYAAAVADRQRLARCLLTLFSGPGAPAARILLASAAAGGNEAIVAAAAAAAAAPASAVAAASAGDGGDLSALLRLLRCFSNDLYGALDHGDGSPAWETLSTLLLALFAALDTRRPSAQERAAPLLRSVLSLDVRAAAATLREVSPSLSPLSTTLAGILGAAGRAESGGDAGAGVEEWQHAPVHAVVCLALGCWLFGGLMEAPASPATATESAAAASDDAAMARRASSLVSHLLRKSAHGRAVHTLSRIVSSPSFICSPCRSLGVATLFEALSQLVRYGSRAAGSGAEGAAHGGPSELGGGIILRTRRSRRRHWIQIHLRATRHGHAGRHAGAHFGGAASPALGPVRVPPLEEEDCLEDALLLLAQLVRAAPQLACRVWGAGGDATTSVVAELGGGGGAPGEESETFGAPRGGAVEPRGFYSPDPDPAGAPFAPSSSSLYGSLGPQQQQQQPLGSESPLPPFLRAVASLYSREAEEALRAAASSAAGAPASSLLLPLGSASSSSSGQASSSSASWGGLYGPLGGGDAPPHSEPLDGGGPAIGGTGAPWGKWGDPGASGAGADSGLQQHQRAAAAASAAAAEAELRALSDQLGDDFLSLQTTLLELLAAAGGGPLCADGTPCAGHLLARMGGAGGDPSAPPSPLQQRHEDADSPSSASLALVPAPLRLRPLLCALAAAASALDPREQNLRIAAYEAEVMEREARAAAAAAQRASAAAVPLFGVYRDVGQGAGEDEAPRYPAYPPTPPQTLVALLRVLRALAGDAAACGALLALRVPPPPSAVRAANAQAVLASAGVGGGGPRTDAHGYAISGEALLRASLANAVSRYGSVAGGAQAGGAGDPGAGELGVLDVVAHLLQLSGLGCEFKAAALGLLATVAAQAAAVAAAEGPAAPPAVPTDPLLAQQLALEGGSGGGAGAAAVLLRIRSIVGALAGEEPAPGVWPSSSAAWTLGAGAPSWQAASPFPGPSGPTLRIELEATEGPTLNHEASLALCSLLRALLRAPLHVWAAAEPGGRPYPQGPVPLAMLELVTEHVLLRAARRPVADEADRPRLAAAALGVLLDALRFDAGPSPDAGAGLLAPGASAGAPLPCGVVVLRRLLSHSPTLEAVVSLLTLQSLAGAGPVPDAPPSPQAAPDPLLTLESQREVSKDRACGAAIASRALAHARALTLLRPSPASSSSSVAAGAWNPDGAALQAAVGARVGLTPEQKRAIEAETDAAAQRCVWATATGGGAAGSVASSASWREQCVLLACALLGAAAETEAPFLALFRGTAGQGGPAPPYLPALASLPAASFLPVGELLRQARALPLLCRLVGYRHSERLGLAALGLLQCVLLGPRWSAYSPSVPPPPALLGPAVRQMLAGASAADIVDRLAGRLLLPAGSDAGRDNAVYSTARVASALRSRHADGLAAAARAGGEEEGERGAGGGLLSWGQQLLLGYPSAAPRSRPAPEGGPAPWGAEVDGGDLWDGGSGLRLPVGLSSAPCPVRTDSTVPAALLPFAPPSPPPDGGAAYWGTGPAGRVTGAAIEQAVGEAGRAALAAGLLSLLDACLAGGLGGRAGGGSVDDGTAVLLQPSGGGGGEGPPADDSLRRFALWALGLLGGAEEGGPDPSSPSCPLNAEVAAPSCLHAAVTLLSAPAEDGGGPVVRSSLAALCASIISRLLAQPLAVAAPVYALLAQWQLVGGVGPDRRRWTVARLSSLTRTAPQQARSSLGPDSTSLALLSLSPLLASRRLPLAPLSSCGDAAHARVTARVMEAGALDLRALLGAPVPFRDKARDFAIRLLLPQEGGTEEGGSGDAAPASQPPLLLRLLGSVPLAPEAPPPPPLALAEALAEVSALLALETKQQQLAAGGLGGGAGPFSVTGALGRWGGGSGSGPQCSPLGPLLQLAPGTLFQTYSPDVALELGRLAAAQAAAAAGGAPHDSLASDVEVLSWVQASNGYGLRVAASRQCAEAWAHLAAVLVSAVTEPAPAPGASLPPFPGSFTGGAPEDGGDDTPAPLLPNGPATALWALLQGTLEVAMGAPHATDGSPSPSSAPPALLLQPIVACLPLAVSALLAADPVSAPSAPTLTAPRLRAASRCLAHLAMRYAGVGCSGGLAPRLAGGSAEEGGAGTAGDSDPDSTVRRHLYECLSLLLLGVQGNGAAALSAAQDARSAALATALCSDAGEAFISTLATDCVEARTDLRCVALALLAGLFSPPSGDPSSYGVEDGEGEEGAPPSSPSPAAAACWAAAQGAWLRSLDGSQLVRRLVGSLGELDTQEGELAAALRELQYESSAAGALGGNSGRGAVPGDADGMLGLGGIGEGEGGAGTPWGQARKPVAPSTRRLRLADTAAPAPGPSSGGRTLYSLQVQAQLAALASSLRSVRRASGLALEALGAIASCSPGASLDGLSPALLLLRLGLLPTLTSLAWVPAAADELTALLSDSPATHIMVGGGGRGAPAIPPVSLDASASEVIAAVAAAAAAPFQGQPQRSQPPCSPLPYPAAIATALSPRLSPLLGLLVALGDARQQGDARTGRAIWAWCAQAAAPLLEVVVAAACSAAAGSGTTGPGLGAAPHAASSGGAGVSLTLPALRLAGAAAALLARLAGVRGAMGALGEEDQAQGAGQAWDATSSSGGGGALQQRPQAWDAGRADSLMLRLFARFLAVPAGAGAGAGGPGPGGEGTLPLPGWLLAVVPCGAEELAAASRPSAFLAPGGEAEGPAHASPQQQQQQQRPAFTFQWAGGALRAAGAGRRGKSTSAAPHTQFQDAVRQAGGALCGAVASYLRSRSAELVLARAPPAAAPPSSASPWGRAAPPGSSPPLLFRPPETGVVTAAAGYAGMDGPLSGLHSLPSLSMLLGAVDAAAASVAGWAAFADAANPPAPPAERSFLAHLQLGFENLLAAWLAHSLADRALRVHGADVEMFARRPHVAGAAGRSPFAVAVLRHLQDLGSD